MLARLSAAEYNFRNQAEFVFELMEAHGQLEQQQQQAGGEKEEEDHSNWPEHKCLGNNKSSLRLACRQHRLLPNPPRLSLGPWSQASNKLSVGLFFSDYSSRTAADNKHNSWRQLLERVQFYRFVMNLRQDLYDNQKEPSKGGTKECRATVYKLL